MALMYNLFDNLLINGSDPYASVATHDSLLTWQDRMADQNPGKENAKHSEIVVQVQNLCCKDCIMGKMHRFLFPRGDPKFKQASLCRKILWKRTVFF